MSQNQSTGLPCPTYGSLVHVHGVVHERRELKAQKNDNIWRRQFDLQMLGKMVPVVVTPDDYKRVVVGQQVVVTGSIEIDFSGKLILVASKVEDESVYLAPKGKQAA